MNKKIPVNAPCPCGSGKKFKKCCGNPLIEDDREFSASQLPKTLVTDQNGACPCGSKKAFGICCEPLLQRSQRTSLSDEAAAKYMARDFVAAEALYRATLVQYLRWVHDHTLPAIARGMPIAAELIKVDREALLELGYAVSECMARSGRAEQIVPFVDHLESIAPLMGFDKDASYLRSTWLHLALDDQSEARRELRKIGPILEYGRREALELYLDVVGAELTERERIGIAEQIISQSEEHSTSRVQYTALKALSLLQIGEGDQGMEELRALLTEMDSPEKFNAVDNYATWQLAKAWNLYGNYKNDDAVRGKAEQLFLSIKKDTLTGLGKAQLYLELGWVLRDRGKYKESADAMRSSNQMHSTAVVKIHLAHSLALSGDTSEARTILVELEREKLSPDLRLEYLGSKGALAIATDDKNASQETVEALKAMDISSPFWSEQRDQLLIEMLEFLHRPESATPATRQRKIIAVLLSMNEFLHLKPSLFGVGVNVNHVIEKLARRFENRIV